MVTIKNFEGFLQEGKKPDAPKKGDVLFTMEKPRSPLTIVFAVDDDVDMIRIKYMTKNGTEKRHNTITKSGVDGWVRSLEKDGYVKVV